jgi:hypothetical protein
MDLIKALGKKFAPDLPKKRIEGGLPTMAIKVGHGQIHHANVA